MSNKYYLQKGDIIRLEPGMKIYASFPEKFLYTNQPFSNKLAHHDIYIGKVIRKNVPERSEIIEEISEEVSNILNIDVDSKKVEAFVDSLNLDFSPEEFDTSVFAGTYRVYDAGSDGGTIDDNPKTSITMDSYPNGWHVFCEKLDNPEIRVDFYQDGFFTAVISDIKPIRSEN